MEKYETDEIQCVQRCVYTLPRFSEGGELKKVVLQIVQ